MSYDQLNRKSLDKEEIFPIALYEKFKDFIGNEEILLTTASNLNLKGQYEETWIVVTEQKVHILENEANDVKIRTFLLKEIQDIHLDHFYGVGSIQIITKERSYEIARFTRKHNKKFYKFVEYFKKILQNEEFDIHAEIHERDHESIYGENRCPKCGGPLPRGSITCPKCTNKSATFRRLLTYLYPYKGRALLMLLTTMTYSLLSLVQPYLQKIMIDTVIAEKRIDAIKWVILAIFGAQVLGAAFQGLRSLQLSWLGERIIYDMRSQVYNHLQKLGLSYYDRRMTGAIMNRVTGDTASIQGFIVNGIQEIIVQVMSMLLIVFILFSMNWKLTLIVLIPTPFIYFGTKLYSGRMHKIYHRVWRRRSNLSAVLGGTIPGIKVVKAFTQEKHEVDKFEEALQDYFNEEIRAAKNRSVFFPLLSLTTSIGAVLIWGYGSYSVIAGGDLSLGTLTAFIGYMWRFYQPVQMLSNISGQFQMASTAAERVFEVLDHEPEIKREIQKPKPLNLKGEIIFKNVSFRYNNEDDVLKNINLHIKPGEMIGLVGSSGAGKSTLVNLIPRFYEVTEGQLLIDGKDVNEYDLTALRAEIGVVLQEPFLFYGTIAENIAYGRPDATMEEIVWAAKAANAHKFIMGFPDGYDTLVGERGIGLSGGEKQRISIARAILKDPKILILDEATSSVDTETEKLIQEAIDYLIKDRTTIAIAHRLSTLKNADRIVVLDNGTIVEEGTHDELMALENGVFRHLVEIQSEIARTNIMI